jgi:hypothetical protein
MKAVSCAFVTLVAGAALAACSPRAGDSAACLAAAQATHEEGVRAALSGENAKAIPLLSKAVDAFGSCRDRVSGADRAQASYRRALSLMNESVALGAAGDARACAVAEEWVAELRRLADDPAADIPSSLQVADGTAHAQSIKREAALLGGALTAKSGLCRRTAGR